MTGELERWLPIVGWEGFYEVSDLGRVRSLDRVVPHPRGDLHLRGKILKLGYHMNEYRTTVLSRPGVRRTPYVHQLVLTTFIGERPEGMVACHGVGGRWDNRLSNLRWGTQSENVLDWTTTSDTNQVNARKTTCARGHRLVPPNLLAESWVPDRWRKCLACYHARNYTRRTEPFISDRNALADRYYAIVMRLVSQ